MLYSLDMGSLTTHTIVSNQKNNVITGAKHNKVGDNIHNQLGDLGEDVVEVTETSHPCCTREKFMSLL